MKEIINTLINLNKNNDDICRACGGNLVIDTTYGNIVCTSCGCVYGQVYVN